jgi:hypothetical protein
VFDSVDGAQVVAAVDIALLGGLVLVYGRLTTLSKTLLSRCRHALYHSCRVS